MHNHSVLIRADGSASLGMGHISRCIALAETCKETRTAVWFACYRPDSAVLETLQRAGYPVVNVNRSPDDPAVEARDIAARAMEIKAQWLVLDHPALGVEHESIIRQYYPHSIVVIDGRFRLHCCDTLINPNAFATTENCRDTVPIACQILAGYRYFMLQDKYLHHQDHHEQASLYPLLDATAADRLSQADTHSNHLPGLHASSTHFDSWNARPPRHRVLITLGGADPDNVTLKVCQAMAATDFGDSPPVFDVVLGSANAHRSQVLHYLENTPPGQFIAHDAPQDLVELLRSCTVCISAAGITLGEAAFLARPIIGIAIVDDQQATIASLQELGILQAASLQSIARQCRDLLNAPDIRNELSARSSALVDGRGKLRIADQLWNR